MLCGAEFRYPIYPLFIFLGVWGGREIRKGASMYDVHRIWDFFSSPSPLSAKSILLSANLGHFLILLLLCGRHTMEAPKEKCRLSPTRKGQWKEGTERGNGATRWNVKPDSAHEGNSITNLNSSCTYDKIELFMFVKDIGLFKFHHKLPRSKLTTRNYPFIFSVRAKDSRGSNPTWYQHMDQYHVPAKPSYSFRHWLL